MALTEAEPDAQLTDQRLEAPVGEETDQTPDGVGSPVGALLRRPEPSGCRVNFVGYSSAILSTVRKNRLWKNISAGSATPRRDRDAKALSLVPGARPFPPMAVVHAHAVMGHTKVGEPGASVDRVEARLNGRQGPATVLPVNARFIVAAATG